MLNKEEIKKNFSRSAKDYDRHAGLQNGLADELFLKLATVHCQPSTVLDIGCGTGYLTRKIAAAFPAARVIGIDLAPGMIAVAQEKNNPPNAGFELMDGECFAFAENHFDLIVSNASLQWMNFEEVLNCVAYALQLKGFFLFNTFGPQTLIELKAAGFRVNNFLSVDEIFRLVKNRFDKAELDEKVITQRYNNVKDLLLNLKGIGAQSVDKRAVNSAKKAKLNEPITVSYEVISGFFRR